MLGKDTSGRFEVKNRKAAETASRPGGIARHERGEILGAYRLSRMAAVSMMFAASVAAATRLFFAIKAAIDGRMDPLNGFGFGVILPFTLIVLITLLGPSKTRESGLMRAATIIQLILVISLPQFALHLLLGLPVAFLAVEIFETRLPRSIREPISRMLVR